MLTELKKYLPAHLARQIKKVWQNTQALYYSGNKYFCPFCNRSYRKFRAGGFDLPVNKDMDITGAGYRKNMLCPGCYSTDRDRLLFLFVKHYTELLNKAFKMLHVAPSGALSNFFSQQKNIEYTPGTKYHEGVYYPGNIDIIDITELKYADNTFDVIFCNHVLEHIQNDRKAMKELFRVLKPGGWAVLQVPVSRKLKETYEDPSITDPAERERHYGQFDHVRIYGCDYSNRLEEAGFLVEKLNLFAAKMIIDDIEKYSLNQNEDIFLAKKTNL